jgi:hypothetical protein
MSYAIIAPASKARHASFNVSSNARQTGGAPWGRRGHRNGPEGRLVMSTHQHKEHHEAAAEHHAKAAAHHRKAAEHYEEGDHEKGGHHAHLAHAHGLHATHAANEAAKHHADKHDGHDEEDEE